MPNPFSRKKLQKDPMQYNDLDRYRQRVDANYNKNPDLQDQTDVKSRISEMLQRSSPQTGGVNRPGLDLSFNKPSDGSAFQRLTGKKLPQGKVTGQNGRLDRSKLAPIGQGSHAAQPAAAAAFRQMAAAAARDGINLRVTDSYRDYATQVDLVRRKGLYSKGGLAAKPGTSNHGWGLAFDIANGHDWLARNGPKFGFKTIPREPWHWEYIG